MGRKRKEYRGEVSNNQSAVGLDPDSPTASGTSSAETEAQPPTNTESFSVEEIKTLDDDKRAKKLEAAARWRAKRKARESGVDIPDNPDILTASAFLTVLDSLVIAWVGGDGAMLPNERQMIEQPLIRMLARMDDGTREAVNKWADPLMLFSGLSMYFLRAVAIQQDKREALSEVVRQPSPVESPAEVKPLFDVQTVQRDPDLGDASPSPQLYNMVSGQNGVTL